MKAITAITLLSLAIAAPGIAAENNEKPQPLRARYSSALKQMKDSIDRQDQRAVNLELVSLLQMLAEERLTPVRTTGENDGAEDRYAYLGEDWSGQE